MSDWRGKLGRGIVSLYLATVAQNIFAADSTVKSKAPRTAFDVGVLLDQYRPDEAKVKVDMELMLRTPPEGASANDLARFYHQRGLAADRVGNVRQRLEDYRRASDLVTSPQERWWVLNSLYLAEAVAGNFRNALTVRKSAADITRNIPTLAIHDVVFLETAYIMVGDLSSAKSALSDAETLAKALASSNSWARYQYTFTSRIEEARGRMSFAVGRYELAEAQFQKSISSLEQYIKQVISASGSMVSAPVSELHQRREDLLAKLAQAQISRGQYYEAELSLREALKSALSNRGIHDAFAQRIVTHLGQLLTKVGRFKESEAVIRKSLRTLNEIGVTKESFVHQFAVNALIEALVGQSKWADAIELHKDWGRLSDSSPKVFSIYARDNVSIAYAMVRAGKSGDALALISTQLPQIRQWVGSDQLEAAELLGLQAVATAASGAKPKALEIYQEAVPILINAARDRDAEVSALSAMTIDFILESYLALLAQIKRDPLLNSSGLDPTSEAFRVADVMHSHTTQAAVTASAARAAANDPAIGTEIRKEQDLQQESAALYRILRDLMNVPPEQQLPKVIADMRTRIEKIKSERVALQADIEKHFPAYANLVRPQPPSLADARAVLRPGEALLNVFSAPSATYVWAMKKDGPVAFHVVPLGREDLAGMVGKLRAALDPGDVDIATSLPRFDFATGFDLYSKLLAPVIEGWQGATSLLVATNGTLGQLPLAVLPTQGISVPAPQVLPYAEYASAPWLIRQMAVTQLPSVNALLVLRRLPAGNPGRSPFIGFGDPQFGKTQLAAAGNRRLRNLNIVRTEATAVPAWVDYSMIPPLPDTREEILSLAATLKADTTQDVFLGPAASKANVKKLDLSKRKVVAFATHGLLPNDFPGVAEPSLALANPNDGTHGLLTLEDILGLKLDADWVVLSACNTAGGDGSGADAVSGLGRGFFYAGTRALLVTHWPVESVSAKLLVTGLFDRQAADPKLSRAQALRQSMLALMENKSEAFAYAHPLFWAPYALVGDDGG